MSISLRILAGKASVAQAAALVCFIISASPLRAQSPKCIDGPGTQDSATLSRMYEHAFRVQNSMDAQALEQEERGTSGSAFRDFLRLKFKLTEEQFAPFEASVLRFDPLDQDTKTRTHTLSEVDRAAHPGTRALSPDARNRILGLLAGRDKAASDEVEAIHEALDPVIAKVLDDAVASLYGESRRSGLREGAMHPAGAEGALRQAQTVAQGPLPSVIFNPPACDTCLPDDDDDDDDGGGGGGGSGGPTPTVTLSISFTGNKSAGDNLSFEAAAPTIECSESLNLHSCPTYWGWNIEGKGVVSDGAPFWTVTQSVTSGANQGYYKNSSGTLVSFGGPIKTTDLMDSSVVQATAGQTTIYWIDGPGHTTTYPNPIDGQIYPIDSITQVQNLTTTFCSSSHPSDCNSINWYSKLVVDPGAKLDTAQSASGLGSASTTF